MCTAIYTTDTEGGVWLARTLDTDRDYGEAGVMTPRGYLKGKDSKYGELAMIGTAATKNGMPLYFEAVNEHGVGVAALNFTKSAIYQNFIIPFSISEITCAIAWLLLSTVI